MKNPCIDIAGRKVGIDHRPFIVAEMSANHNQSLSRALRIVEAAARAGCDAVKLQTYTAETMTLPSRKKTFLVTDKKSLWKGEYLYDLYRRNSTPWEWHEKIFKRCHQLGLICFSSPFDESAVDFLESLKVPAYKIASFENTHHPLLRKVARTGKPVILSTGMASFKELKESVNVLRKAGCRQVCLLKCTSAYPSPVKDANLRTIPHLAESFKCVVGLSDHTLGVSTSAAAVALGARLIEKHFTLRRSHGGADAAFSMEPEEMRQLVQLSREVFLSLGKVFYGTTGIEKKSLKFRRSIFAVRDIKKQEKINSENIKVIRPGNGLAPKYFAEVIGRRAARPIAQGTPLRWELLTDG